MVLVVHPRRADREEGNGVVEFVLVTVLVLFLFLVVLQAGLALHTRDVLTAAAAEGARYGANADRTDADGAARALEVVADALPGRVADSAEASAVPPPTDADPRLVDVELEADLPVVLLPMAPIRLTVHGHAVKEGP